MREITVKCKNCGKEFGYSEAAIQVSLENAESEPLRCEECRSKHGKEMRKLSFAFALPKARTRSRHFAGLTGGTYRKGMAKVRQDIKAFTAGMEFGITDEHLENLYRKLQDNDVVVLVSGTGSGKSTLVPAWLINPPEGEAKNFLERLARQGRIAVTQPRIPAVYKVASAIGKIAGSRVGPSSLLGFRHGSRKGRERKEGEQWNRYNRLVIVTDGSLRNWIQSGEIRKYSLIIVDEAHERNKNIDVIFGLLKRALKSHPRLKVIVASATINEELFVQAFKGTGVKVKLLPIPNKKQAKYFGPHFWQTEEVITDCDCWFCSLPPEERQSFWQTFDRQVYENTLSENAAELALSIAKQTDRGSILIFLHGQYEIEKVENLLQSRLKGKMPVITLFSNLGESEVESRLKRIEKSRGIILATNIAETSLTISNLCFVIDSGFIKEKLFDAEKQTENLVSRYHSKDGCNQRWGRVGRTEIGYVFTLYTERQWNDDEVFEPHTTPAIVRESLDDVLVTVAGAGVDNIELFPWLETPNKKRLAEARKNVEHLAMVDRMGDLTERGAVILSVPLDASVVSLVNAACQMGCFTEILIFFLFAFTRDGAFRLGDNLYDKETGFLIWNSKDTDSRWDSRTKARVHAIHRSLWIGCQDDVDLVLKLFDCFREAVKEGQSEWWAEKFYVNHRVFSTILKDYQEFCERFYRKNAKDEDIRQFDAFRLAFLRRLLRECLPDSTLKVIGEKEERRVGRMERFIDQLVPVGTLIPIHVIDGEPYFKSPAPEEHFIRCQWVGKIRREKAYILEWILMEKESCARISALSEVEISKGLSIRLKANELVKIVSIERDAHGHEGVAILEIADGLQFPVPLETLGLSWAGYGLERTVGQSMTLDVIGAEIDGRPILSNIYRLVADMERFFGGRDEAVCEGLIEKINLEKSSVVAVVPMAGNIIHGFELFRWRAVSHGYVKYLHKGERIILELIKRKGHCVLPIELSSGKLLHLPKGFWYDEKEQKFYFPFCLNPTSLKKSSLPVEIREVILRFSWQRGIEAKVKSLKERLLKLQENQVVIGKIIDLNYQKDNSEAVRSAQIILSDGTPAFAFVASIPSNRLKAGEEFKFVIDKLNPDDGYLRLVSVESYKGKLEIDMEQLKSAFARRVNALSRLKEALDRKIGQLQKAREDLAKNHEQYQNARTSEHQTRVQSWIDEKQVWIAKLTSDISDIRFRILDLENEISNIKTKFAAIKAEFRRQDFS